MTGTGGTGAWIISLEEQVQLIFPGLVTMDLNLPHSFPMTRYFLQSSPAIPGVLLLQPLLQFPPVAVFTFPYFMSELLRDSLQFLLIPRSKTLFPLIEQDFNPRGHPGFRNTLPSWTAQCTQHRNIHSP